MRDLQHRLVSLGFDVGDDEPGAFGPRTAEAVRGFQRRRGLRVDGICGPQTWGVLVEAGYRPGDRLLYHTSPPLRGDDVAELQRRLGSLGFDAGRVDGIFGPDTQAALLDFQRNAGLTADAVCGPEVLAVLASLGSRTGEPRHVAAVREREALRRLRGTLQGRRVVVGDAGGFSALADAAVRALQSTGAEAVAVHHPDGSVQAAQANSTGADVYLAVTPAESGCVACYYAAHGFESSGGRRLAECVAASLGPVVGSEGRVAGMAVPVLRETRMPAVVCELGPPSTVVAQGAAVAQGLTHALSRWVQAVVEV